MCAEGGREGESSNNALIGNNKLLANNLIIFFNFTRILIIILKTQKKNSIKTV